MGPITTPIQPQRQNKAQWQTAFWSLVGLAVLTMSQPCGEVCSMPSHYRTYLRTSPFLCAADTISIIVRWVAISVCLRVSPTVLIVVFLQYPNILGVWSPGSTPETVIVRVIAVANVVVIVLAALLIAFVVPDMETFFTDNPTIGKWLMVALPRIRRLNPSRWRRNGDKGVVVLSHISYLSSCLLSTFLRPYRYSQSSLDDHIWETGPIVQDIRCKQL
jgi:hypothetical protein